MRAKLYQLPVEDNRCFRTFNKKVPFNKDGYEFMKEFIIPPCFSETDEDACEYIFQICQSNPNNKFRSCSMSDLIILDDTRGYVVDMIGFANVSDRI